MTSGPIPSRPHRLDARLVIGALIFMAGCAYVVVSLVGLRQSLDSERQSQAADSTAISQLSAALDTTRQQLQQHGVTPKAAPPSEIIQGVPGATGPAGQSITGPQGPPGRDAPTPNPTAIASQAAGMVHPGPGPSGPAGPQGQPGQNSNVPGPQGPQGEQGNPGPPPSSWTWSWTDATGVTHTYQCTQTSSGSTSYACQETGTSTPPSPGPTPSQSATLLAQAPVKPKQAVVSTGPR